MHVPGQVQGRDLSSLARTANASQTPPCRATLVQWFGNPRYHPEGEPGLQWRAVRTPRNTYAVGEGGWGMLFDNETDPYQLTNLYDEPDHSALRGRLHAWLVAELEDAGEAVPDFIR